MNRLNEIRDYLYKKGYTSISVNKPVVSNARHINISTISCESGYFLLTFGSEAKTKRLVKDFLSGYFCADDDFGIGRNGCGGIIVLPDEDHYRPLVSRDLLIRAVYRGAAISLNETHTDETRKYLDNLFPMILEKSSSQRDILFYADPDKVLETIDKGIASEDISNKILTKSPSKFILDSLVYTDKHTVLESYNLLKENSVCVFHVNDDNSKILEFVRKNIKATS